MSDKKPSLRDLSRRSYLALLGATGSGAAALGSVDSTDSNDKIAAGGFESNLTEFSSRDKYATGPDGLFDISQLQENEIYWKTDSGELGVKGPDGPERPPMNVSSLEAEQLQTDARSARVVVHERDDGTIVADGPDSELYEGDDVGAAANAAFDSLPDGRDHQEVVAIKGEFDLSTQIIVPSMALLDLTNCRLINDGTISSQEPMVVVGEPNGEAIGARLNGGVIDGNRDNTDNDVIGVEVDGDNVSADEKRCWINGTHIQNTGYRGLIIGVRRTIVNDVNVQYAGDWGAVTASSDINTNNLLVRDCDDDGIRLQGAWGHHWHMISHGNHSRGIHMTGANNIIHGGYTEHNRGDGITISASPMDPADYDHTDFAIRDMKILANDSVGIRAVECHGGSIENCTFHDMRSEPQQEEAVNIGENADHLSLRDIRYSENPGGGIVNNSDTTVFGADTSEGYEIVTDERSFDEWEQAPVDADVYVNVDIETTASPGSTLRYMIDVNDEQSNYPVTEYRNEDPTEGEVRSRSFKVPAGQYYRVRESTSGGSLYRWTESVSGRVQN